MSTFGIRQRIGFFSGPLLFLLILFLPRPEGMAPEAQRVAAVAILMAVWWITEALPIPATALLPIVLFPFLGVMKSSQVTLSYANHLIYLFMGGFFIAVTMEKWNLHRRVALLTIFLVGTGPSRIVLGFMLATAFLSMWISNTATTMMMVPIALAVVGQAAELLGGESADGVDVRPGRFAFGMALMLGIAYAASIGGVATLIGTPPNTIMAGLVEKMYGRQIGFAEWMLFGFPLSMVMLFLTWGYLVRIAFPLRIKSLPGGRAFIRAELKKLGSITREELRILCVFLFVAAAWILRGFVKIEALSMVHDATIAVLGGLLLFMIPVNFREGRFLLDWQTAIRIPWDIIVLFGGGLALASGFQKTGLSQWIAQGLAALSGVPVLFLVLAVVLVTIFLTEVTSNTATASMLIPVMGSLAVAVTIHPYGLIFGAALAASFAFMLPVATPPNAVVFGSGYVTIPQMARTGFWLNVLGAGLITLFVVFVLTFLWGIDLGVLPDWAK